MEQSARTQKMIESLKQAILAEGDGYHLYSQAARTTPDAKGAALLDVLAHEELDHLQFLRAHYQALVTTGELAREVRLGARADLSGPSPIFSETLRSRLKDARVEMSVLSIGIQLERNSMDFYRSQAEALGEGPAATFFGELADWEMGHYQALLQQQRELADDYWALGGFSPF